MNLPTKTAVRVISMDTARERRAIFTAGANNCRVEWSYFSALRHPEKPLVCDEGLASVVLGRPLRPGEISCYASHFAAWCWFLKSDNDQLVVLEDDVIVDWAVLKFLGNHDLSSIGIDVLKLYASHPLKSNVVAYKLFSDHSHLLQLKGYCYGTQAYLLTKRGAAALVTSCQSLTMPVDWAMSRYWDYGVANYAVFPFPVFERLGPSIIGHSSEAYRVRAKDKIVRLRWRLHDRARRAIVDLSAQKVTFENRRDTGAPLLL